MATEEREEGRGCGCGDCVGRGESTGRIPIRARVYSNETREGDPGLTCFAHDGRSHDKLATRPALSTLSTSGLQPGASATRHWQRT